MFSPGVMGAFTLDVAHRHMSDAAAASVASPAQIPKDNNGDQSPRPLYHMISCTGTCICRVIALAEVPTLITQEGSWLPDAPQCSAGGAPWLPSWVMNPQFALSLSSKNSSAASPEQPLSNVDDLTTDIYQCSIMLVLAHSAGSNSAAPAAVTGPLPANDEDIPDPAAIGLLVCRRGVAGANTLITKDDGKQMTAVVPFGHRTNAVAWHRKFALPPSDVIYCSTPMESVEVTTLVTVDLPLKRSNAASTTAALVARECLVVPFTRDAGEAGSFYLTAYLLSAIQRGKFVHSGAGVNDLALSSTDNMPVFAADPSSFALQLREMPAYHTCVALPPVPTPLPTSAIARVEFRGAWRRTLDTVGGVFPSSPSFSRNPQFLVSTKGLGGAPVRVLLALVCDHVVAHPHKPRHVANASGRASRLRPAAHAHNTVLELGLSVWRHRSSTAGLCSELLLPDSVSAKRPAKRHLLQAADLVAVSDFSSQALGRAQSLLVPPMESDDEVPRRIVYCDFWLNPSASSSDPASSPSEYVLLAGMAKGLEGSFRLIALSDAP